ncbi:MAG: hypothetical protein IPM63_03345 [Acidobacteriota bacterium]|nr:MAG: hypothetical protein IPM63_03345 [Acidobacteriota bacterium]
MAIAITFVNSTMSSQAEKAVTSTLIMLVSFATLPILVYFARHRLDARLSDLGLLILATASTLLFAIYLFTASYYVCLSADILIWSESDFVNDILKYRNDYPIFSAEVNNESFTYTPGTQLLTSVLAQIAGQPDSIPVYRMIQVGYSILAAILALLCVQRLVKRVSPEDSNAFHSPLWTVVCLIGSFLIATNTATNPFAHLLHNDALAQLLTVAAFWLLLIFDDARDKRILWLMAILPAVGFWVKQSLIIWAIFYLAFLVIFDRDRSVKRIIGFAVCSFGGVLFSAAIGYWLWQDDFVYWVFTVLGEHGVSPLRSFRHLLSIWPYYAVGLLGGLVLMQVGELKKFFGLWLIWLGLISLETYTSGVAWMLNHIGPGCLIAGTWFFAGLFTIWNRFPKVTIRAAGAKGWLLIWVATTVVCLLFSGLSLVRVPVEPFDYADAKRYIGEIENEFVGQPKGSILLDLGTWVYVSDGIVMKDRAPSIGERGYSQTGDFSGILERLKRRQYKKILIRNFHSTDFWYDHELWSKSSGIRQALQENYKETGRIKAVGGLKPEELPYGFSEISILVPRTK